MGWLEGGHVLTRELGGPVPGQAGPFCGCVISGKAVDFLHRNLHSRAQTERCADNFWEHRSLEATLWTPSTNPLDSMTSDSLELPGATVVLRLSV